MATKRVSPEKKASAEKASPEETAPEKKKTSRRKKPAAADGNGHAAPAGSEQTGVSAAAPIDPEHRRQLVAAEAYFRAEKRGFAAGHELDDWVAAEAVVDSRV